MKRGWKNVPCNENSANFERSSFDSENERCARGSFLERGITRVEHPLAIFFHSPPPQKARGEETDTAVKVKILEAQKLGVSHLAVHF